MLKKLKKNSLLKKENLKERQEIIDQISKLNLEEIFPDEEVIKLQKEFIDKLKNENPKESYTKLGNFNHKDIINSQMYAKFTKQENTKNFLHSFYMESFWNFKMESLVFFYHNSKEKISNKIDYNNYINTSVSDNGIIRIIKLSKTKKFLIYKPRYCLEIKIIKQFDENKIIEFYKSIDFSILNKNELFKKLIQTFDQQYYLHTHFQGLIYENLDNICKQTFFKISNNKSKVGFKVLKNIFKSSAKVMSKKTLKMLEKFYKDIKKGKKELNSTIYCPIKDFNYNDLFNGKFDLKFFEDFKLCKKYFKENLGKGMSLTEIKNEEEENEGKKQFEKEEIDSISGDEDKKSKNGIIGDKNKILKDKEDKIMNENKIQNK